MMVNDNTLLCLLCTALHREVNIEDYLCEIDWPEVMDLAIEQGVGAIAFDGVNLLYDKGVDLKIPAQTKIRWFAATQQNESEYLKSKKTLASLAKFFAKHSLDTMLLKGYGLSLNYPIPNHRPSGDIDIYLRHQSSYESLQAWEKGDNLIKEKGIEVDPTGEHHSHFSINGILIENHKNIIGVDSHMSNGQVHLRLMQMFDDNEKIDVDGAIIEIPSPDFNMIYLLRHAGQHFATERIVLRHVLDWGFVVAKYSDMIHWDEALQFIEEQKMTPLMICFKDMCVDYLGFDGKDFCHIPGGSPLTERVLADILHPEFSEESMPPSMSLKYFIFKTRRFRANRWKYKMVYPESLFQTYTHLLTSKVRSWWKFRKKG